MAICNSGSTNKVVEEILVVSLNLFINKPAESLPEKPAVPEEPEVPLEPAAPDDPLDPLVPVIPEVPLEPEPDVPLEPLCPLDPDDPLIVCGNGVLVAKLFCNKATFTACIYLL